MEIITMATIYQEQAMELVKAQAAVRSMTVSEMMTMRDELAAQLEGVAAAPAAVEEAGPVCDPKGAIKEGSVTCLICGKKMKVLTAKHLAKHDITPEDYRAKFGYKKGQPLAAKSLSRARRTSMKNMKLWTRRQKPVVAEVPAEKPAKKAKAEAAAS